MPARHAVPEDYPKEQILAQECEPVRITRRLPAQKLIVTPKGELVIDFGQNITGLVQARLKGERGKRLPYVMRKRWIGRGIFIRIP